MKDSEDIKTRFAKANESNEIIFMNTQEVADLLNVSARTVRYWIQNKKLKAVKLGGWRVTNEDLIKFLKERSNIEKQ